MRRDASADACTKRRNTKLRTMALSLLLREARRERFDAPNHEVIAMWDTKEEEPSEDRNEETPVEEDGDDENWEDWLFL